MVPYNPQHCRCKGTGSSGIWACHPCISCVIMVTALQLNANPQKSLSVLLLLNFHHLQCKMTLLLNFCCPRVRVHWIALTCSFCCHGCELSCMQLYLLNAQHSKLLPSSSIYLLSFSSTVTLVLCRSTSAFLSVLIVWVGSDKLDNSWGLDRWWWNHHGPTQ